MLKQIALMVSLLFSAASLAATPPRLKLFSWSIDIAPIVSVDPKTGGAFGIVVDILNTLPKQHQVRLEVILHNRNRGEEALYDGELDAAPLAKPWLKHPERLIYTLPIYVHKEYLYARSPVADQPFSMLLENKNVCTRRGYVYPAIQPLIDEAKVTRVDSHIELTQFEMLLKGRCDFVLTNEFVGQWLIETNGWQNSIFRSKQTVDQVDFTLAFHPSWQTFVSVLNQHIQQLSDSGALQQIIDSQRRLM